MERHAVDLTGHLFGRWTVLRRDGYKGKYVAYLCRCECGVERRVIGAKLSRGKSKSCGCLRSELISARVLEDLTGRRFGALVVIKRVPQKTESGHARWLCLCDCGREHSTNSDSLKKHRETICCSSCRAQRLSMKVAKGSGPVTLARRSLGLTQEEMASKVGCAPSAVAEAEKYQRSFIHERLRAGAHKLKPVNTKDFRNVDVDLCGYCRSVIGGPFSVISRRKRNSARGLIFCNSTCAIKHMHHGPKPIETTTTQLKPETVAPFNPIAKDTRKVDLWAGVKKTAKTKKK